MGYGGNPRHRGSVLQRTNPGFSLVFFWLSGLLQGEVKFDFSKTAADTVSCCTCLIVAEGDFSDQFVAV